MVVILISQVPDISASLLDGMLYLSWPRASPRSQERTVGHAHLPNE